MSVCKKSVQNNVGIKRRYKIFSLGCEKLFTGRITSTYSRLIFDSFLTRNQMFLVPFSESGTKVPKLHQIWANWANS